VKGETGDGLPFPSRSSFTASATRAPRLNER
jgi:hypothetical protein